MYKQQRHVRIGTFGSVFGSFVLLLDLFDFHDPHFDVLDLGFGIGQHLLGFGQQLLVARGAVAVLLDHVLRSLLHLRKSFPINQSINQSINACVCVCVCVWIVEKMGP